MIQNNIYGYGTNDEIYALSKVIKQYSFQKALIAINQLIEKYPESPECYMIKAGLLKTEDNNYKM